jgi:hypothetical protein
MLIVVDIWCFFQKEDDFWTVWDNSVQLFTILRLVDIFSKILMDGFEKKRVCF